METMESIKLDSKDLEILRELDINFRESFSNIGKKVGLSKNSVSLRFEKLKECTLHNMTGLNYDLIGLTSVRVYYSLNFYNPEIEKAIISEASKYKNIQWVARYYGVYDICISLLVNNLDELIFQINKFDEKFAGRINKKEVQIFVKQNYFRYNFFHKKPIDYVSKLEKKRNIIHLSSIDKKIIKTIFYEPRMSIMDISKKIKVTPKTVSGRLKHLKESGVIMGYFMTINPIKFNFETFKLILKLQNLKKADDFEKCISLIKNIKFFSRMIGMWDYEIDFIYPNITELQRLIEYLKEKFPNLFKEIEIMSLGKRIFTNKDKSFIQ